MHGNTIAVALLDPALGIPHVVGDLSKDALAHHHPRTAWLVMIKANESGIAVFRIKIGPIVRENVRVQVDLH